VNLDTDGVVDYEFENDTRFLKILLFEYSSYIKTVFHVNQTLTSLDILGNQIGPNGVKAFSDTLYQNNSLLRYLRFLQKE
ncbi:20363_t:CDS:1, partial [Gigaspora rosea]